MSIVSPKSIVRQQAASYHADKTRVSRSQLVDFIKSPWLYYMRHVKRDPAWQQAETDDMRFGTAFHSIALDGKSFDDCVDIIPAAVLNADGERRGNAYKDWAAMHDASKFKRPKEVEEDRKVIDDMMESLAGSRAAHDLLNAAGHPLLAGESPVEVGVHWDYDGIEMRTRLDRLNSDVIVDLKTARCCDLHKVNNDLETMGYYLQNAFYEMAVEYLTGERLRFAFIFVEKAIPFRTMVVELEREWIDAGRAEIHAALSRLQRASDTGEWQDPCGDTAITLPRPKFGVNKLWIDNDESL